MPTQRYKLTIAYRGTHYHGWQTQAMNPTWTGPIPPEGEGIPTIQEKLTRAIKAVVLHPLIISGSSRTDTGVHAKGQVAHFDTDKIRNRDTGHYEFSDFRFGWYTSIAPRFAGVTPAEPGANGKGDHSSGT